MGRPRKTIPKLCSDANGRAFAKVDGKFITLGRAGSQESQLRYAQLLSDLAQGKSVAPKGAPKSTSSSVTVAEVCLRFMTDYAIPRYKTADGKSSAEVDCFRSAIRIMRELFGGTPASDFQALRLRVVRKSMVEGDPNAVNAKGEPSPRLPWSRRWVNKQVGRIRLMFRVAASWEMVEPSVIASLETLPPLSPGETTAPETKPRSSVADSDLAAVRSVLSPFHRDIFDLLLLCGARPAELITLRVGMIDRTGDTWRSDLAKHKTAHHGKRRTLFFNSAAQLILQKYLTSKPDDRLFEIERNSYGHAIKRACDKAGVTPFVPHQLRHTVATKLADELGTEAAQRLLGHATRAMTEHYSRTAEKLALEAVNHLK